MKRLTLLFSTLVAAAVICFGAVTKPDFAFPADVISQSRATLSTSNTPAERLNGLLALITANQQIDNNSLKTSVKVIDSLLSVSRNDTERALLLTLEAEVYNQVRINTKTRDRNDLPLYPYPNDLSEWSEQQFTHRIDSLSLAAWNMAKLSCASVPLSDYSDVVTADKLSLIYFPTVRDFIAASVYKLATNNKTELLKDITASTRELSPNWFYFKCEADNNFKNIYEAHSDCEAARYALLQWCNQQIGKDDNDSLIAIVKKSFTDFPNFCQNDELRNYLNLLTQPNATASFDVLTYPNKKFDITVKYQNADSVGFAIFRKPTSTKRAELIRKNLIELQQVKVNTTNAISSETFSYKLDNEGEYLITPVINGKYGSTCDGMILCRKIMPFTVFNCDTIIIGAVDAESGKPLQGAQIVNSNGKNVGETDANGLFKTSADYKNQLTLRDRNVSSLDYKLTGSNVRATESSAKTAETFGNIFIDKPIYRPGDVVNWMAIITEGNGKRSAIGVAVGRKIAAKLRTSNYQFVDSLTLTTDEYGRINGSFTLPEGGLTGNYNISLMLNNQSFASTYLPVSEYKMPTFEVTTTELQRSEDVTIYGNARTYSAMPVAEAKVSAKLMSGIRSRYFYGSNYVTTLSGVTDNDGNFSITIPREIIEQQANESRTNFSAAITVTAQSGESADCSVNFATGKPYVIDDNLSEYIFNTDKPVTLNVKAYDINNNAADVDLRYSLIDKNNRVVATSNSNENINWSKVSSGTYDLRIEPCDTMLCDAVTISKQIRLYSFRKGTMPEDKLIFIIKNSYQTDATGKVTVDYGVSDKDTYVYTYLSYGTNVSDMELKKQSAGFKTMTYNIPDSYDLAEMTIITVKDCKSERYAIKLQRPKDRALNITAASFRDKLTAGDTETWNFKLSHSDNTAATGAMIATMYNHSLDAIKSLNWLKAFRYYAQQPQANLYISRSYNTLSNFTIDYKSIDYKTLSYPNFAYSDLWWHRNIKFKIRGTTKAESAVEYEVKAVSGANSAYFTLATAENADDLAAEVTLDGDTDTGHETNSNSDSFDYRDSNVTTAFWQPILTANDNGEVSLTFTVPNANTTWNMETFAWTNDLKYGSLIRQFISNKPIMAQPNLPRYLRQGDKAHITATIFNNTDSATVTNSVIELFDINNGNILQSTTSRDSIAAMQSIILAIDITAPIDVTAIGYRIRSFNQGFSDGEQTLIPILTASSTVVESELFYLNPKDNGYSLTVQDDDTAINTLQYCANPIWSVVKAMSGLRGNNQTVINAAISLSTNANAKYIADNNPGIEHMIAAWEAAPQDSALVSMLLRNSDLKLANIDETPWVQTADNANMRMAALSDIFDKTKVQTAISNSLKALKDNQNSDGGWRWASWCNQSSMWVTENVLLRLKLAKAIGSLGDRADLMISRAMAYYDKYTDNANRTHALLHALTTDKDISLKAKQLNDKEVQNIIKTWRKDGATSKAIDAIILYRNGYKSVAKQIIASLEQFAVEQPGKGMTFPSVKRTDDYAWIVCAFNMISPDNKVIDKMRQWLIVQTQATDDLGACNPDYLISAILMTGTPWLNTETTPSVSINGAAPTIDSIEAGSGYFSMHVNSGDNITISPNGTTPSYGSVTAISRRQMTDIAAYDNDDLKIEKRIIADGNYTDTLRLGERVKVLLTITVNRNMEYVTIIDERPATLEPVEQVSQYIYTDGVSYYRENRDSSTRLFINYLRKGTYQISYDMTANLVGTYSSGIATLQSQYAPELTAHSSGMSITVK